MSQQTSELAERRLRLQEVLLGYLRVADLPCWPGADGLTVEEVLECYPHAVAAGLVPGREELLLRHAVLADVLPEVCAARERPDVVCGGRNQVVEQSLKVAGNG